MTEQLRGSFVKEHSSEEILSVSFVPHQNAAYKYWKII